MSGRPRRLERMGGTGWVRLAPGAYERHDGWSIGREPDGWITQNPAGEPYEPVATLREAKALADDA